MRILQENEKRFNRLIQIVCRLEELMDQPLERDHLIEKELSQLEFQAGMDGYIYRVAHGKRLWYVLVEMSEEEFKEFHRLVALGSISL